MKRLSLVLAALALAALAACGTPSTSLKGTLANSSQPESSAQALSAQPAGSVAEHVDARHGRTTTTVKHGHTTTTERTRHTTTSQPQQTTVPTVPPTPSQSGVAGVVLAGNACTPSSTPQDTTCDEHPAPATIKVLDAAGKVVSTTPTSSHGSFVIGLPAGTYTLKAKLQGAGGKSCPPTSATVQANQYSQVIIDCTH